MRWFVRDLDIRSSLIASTVQEQMTTLIATRSEPRIPRSSTGCFRTSGSTASALPRPAAKPIATRDFPPEINCDVAGPLRRSPKGVRCCRSPRGPLHVAVRPVDSDGMTNAQLVLVHDMSFVARRSEETRRYLFYFFAALGAASR